MKRRRKKDDREGENSIIGIPSTGSPRRIFPGISSTIIKACSGPNISSKIFLPLDKIGGRRLGECASVAMEWTRPDFIN
jgi:hypothetical protein